MRWMLNKNNGMAALEEYLQDKYVELYDEIDEDANKVEELMKIDKYAKFFYIPVNEGKGNLKYIIDGDMHSLYLIKKSELPQEIRENLVGGEAGNKEYIDYASLNDVYGVTSNLKVYYCENGIKSIVGIEESELDIEDSNKQVLGSNTPSQKNLFDYLKKYDLNSDGNLSLSEVKNVTSITITEEDNVKEFSDFYNLINLNSITFDGAILGKLDGLGLVSGLKTLVFQNTTVENYDELAKCGNLEVLKFIINDTENIDGNEEMKKLCGVTERNYRNFSWEFWKIKNFSNMW